MLRRDKWRKITCNFFLIIKVIYNIIKIKKFRGAYCPPALTPSAHVHNYFTSYSDKLLRHFKNGKYLFKRENMFFVKYQISSCVFNMLIRNLCFWKSIYTRDISFWSFFWPKLAISKIWFTWGNDYNMPLGALMRWW